MKMEGQIYKFEMTHQYEGERIKKEIQDAYANSFVLPVWLDLYMQQLINQNEAKDLKCSFQLLDSRYIYKQDSKWRFLAQDLENDVDQFDGARTQIWQKFEKNILGQLNKLKDNDLQEVIIFAASKTKSKKQIWKLYNHPKDLDQKGISNEQKIKKSIKIYVLIRKIQKSEQNKKFNQENWIIQLDPKSVYKFHIQFSEKNDNLKNNQSEKKLEQKPRFTDLLQQQKYFEKQMIGLNPQIIEKIIFNFKITDEDNFIQTKMETKIKQSHSKAINIYTFKDLLEFKQFRNAFIFKSQHYLFQNTREFEKEHYSLAFQGGGAKGVAYVGTYKAMQKTKIPLKSIMGSSAGGITALGVSTGIPFYEIQRICYSMAQIPTKDRFDKDSSQQLEKFKARDEYGNVITFEKITQNIRILLSQYGIFTKQNMDYFGELFQKQNFKQVIHKFITLLQRISPQMGDIFKLKSIPVSQKQCKILCFGFGKEIKHWQHQFNWNGLLLHGALMKGEALHDIAASCLIKYFQKESYLNNNYADKMKDYFIFRSKNSSKEQKKTTLDEKHFAEINFQIKQKSSKEQKKTFGGQLFDQINAYTKNSIDILKLSINTIFQILKKDKEAFLKFLINTTNKFLVMINIYSLNKYKESVIITEIQQMFQKFFKVQINQINNQDTKNQYEYKQYQSDLKKNKDYQQIHYLVKEQKWNLHTFFKVVSLKNKSQKLKQKLEKYYVTFDDKNHQNNQKIQKLNVKIYQLANVFKLMKQTMNQTITYDQLNAVHSTYNLIDFKFLSLKDQTYESNTILQFIWKLFKKIKIKRNDRDLYLLEDGNEFDLDRINNILGQQYVKDQDIFFHVLEMSDQIVKTLETCIRDLYDKNLNDKKLKKEEVKKEKQNYNQQIYFKNQDYKEKLRDKVATITLKQYYDITKIQFTCTSVDLDDKMLRLFNHKTSPDLPVCRTVQMTGSFPVAFKAQRWKKDWGYYYVHKYDKTIPFDITGHEFTDGGLLANFPIKYLDNKQINQRYYSYKTAKNKTILLGFGLDYMDPSTYQPSANQINAQRQKQDLIQKAKQDFKTEVQKLKTSFGLNLWWTSKNIFSSEEQVQWGDIYQKITNEIPLLRFILKIIKAYPNADRNFNIQSFGQQTLTQDMPDRNLLPINDYIVNHSDHQNYFKLLQQIQKYSQNIKQNMLNNQQYREEIKQQHKKDKKKLYFQLNETKRQHIKNSYKWKIQNSLRQFKIINTNQAIIGEIVTSYILNQNGQALRGNIKFNDQQRRNFYKDLTQYNGKIVTKQLQRIGYIKQGFISIINNTFNQQYNLQIQKLFPDFFSQSKQNYYLIEIIFNSLKMQKNSHLRQLINQRYIFHKYIHKYVCVGNPNNANNHNNVNNQNNNNEISPKEADQAYIELNKLIFKSLYLSKEYDEITKHSNFYKFKTNFYKKYVQEFNDYHDENCQLSPTLSQQKKRILEKKFLKQKLDQGIKKLPSQKNAYFCEPLSFDVFFSIKKFIEYLYLQIRTEQLIKDIEKDNREGINADQKLKKLTLLHVNTQYKNFMQLIGNENNQQITPLKYEQIFEFACKLQKKGYKNNKNKDIKIQYNWYFNQYLNYIQIGNGRLQQQIGNGELQQQQLRNGQQLQEIGNGRQQQMKRKYEYCLKELFNCNLYNFNQPTSLKKYYNYFIKLQQHPNRQQPQSTNLKVNYLQQFEFKQKLDQYIQKNSQQIKKKAIQQLKWLQNHDQLLNFIFSDTRSVLDYINQEAIDNMAYDKWKHLDNFKEDTKRYILKYLYGQQYQQLKLPFYYDQQTKKLTDSPIQDIQFDSIYKIQKGIQNILTNVLENINISNNISIIQKVLLYKLNIKSKFVLIQQLLKRYESVNKSQNKQQQLNDDIFYIYFKDFCFLEASLRNILFLLTKLTKFNQRVDQFDANQLCGQTFKVYIKITTGLNDKFDNLLKLSINNMNRQEIDRTFMINYEEEREIIKILVSIVKKLQTLSHYTEQQMKILGHIVHTFDQLKAYKFSIPLLKLDFEFILLYQLKARKTYDSLYNKIKISKQPIHLVFEGVGNSNQYIHNYVYYMQNLRKQQENIRVDQQNQQNSEVQSEIQQNQWSKQLKKQLKEGENYHKQQLQGNSVIIPEDKNPIKYITSSNFHSIFGFLYALGLSIEQIRSRMYHMKYLISAMMDKQKIIKYFDKGLNPNCPSNFYSDLLQHIDGQYGHSLQSFTKNSSKSSPHQRKDYTKDLQDLKDLYLQQKENLVHNYSYILDKIVKQYKEINNNNIYSFVPNQVAKKYAIDFTNRFNDKYKYSQISQSAKYKYLDIVHSLYIQYGQMLEASVGSYINNHHQYDVTPDNAEAFTKGLITIRMMMTYKIKKLIFVQLRKAYMLPTISLKLFNQKCKRKVFLNFTVTNVSEQMLQFLNYNTMPNMPIWAAIIACSRLPIFHTWLWGQRQWQQNTQENAIYTKSLNKFFNNIQNDSRPCTFYNTGNYISSLPIQLLTNEVLIQELYGKQGGKDKSIFYVGLAFNEQYSLNKLDHLNISKSFLKSSKIFTKIIGPTLWSKVTYVFQCINNFLFNWKSQYNTRYQSSYSAIEPAKQALMKGPFFNVFGILSNANDNFVMKEYYNKLVKLPIKINTLEFKNVTDIQIDRRYQVSVPSSKANQTILRSYQITNTFMKNITMRIQTQGYTQKYLLRLIKERNDRQTQQKKDFQEYYRKKRDLQQFLQQQNEIHKKRYYSKLSQKLNKKQDQITKKRFYSTLRAECLSLPNNHTGFRQEFTKLTFLNYTKWNKNRYNNFVVQYAFFENEKIPPIQSFIRSQNSEIIWRVQNSSKIMIRFYYPYFGYQYRTYKYDVRKNKILFTQFELECQQIIKKLPAKSSFDYELVFAEDSQFSFKETQYNSNDIQISYKTLIKLKPTAMNNFDINYKDRRNQENEPFFSKMPSLFLKLTNESVKKRLNIQNITSENIKVPSDFKFKEYLFKS